MLDLVAGLLGYGISSEASLLSRLIHGLITACIQLMAGKSGDRVAKQPVKPLGAVAVYPGAHCVHFVSALRLSGLLYKLPALGVDSSSKLLNMKRFGKHISASFLT